jgi:transcriptional regulator with XRE-family HTH domain
MELSQKSNELGELIRRQRVMIPLALSELSKASGVSSSHLGRIERGERFPSARILRKIAKPLGFDEEYLLISAGFMSPKSPGTEMEDTFRQHGQLDPYVAMVLSKESVEIQRAVIAILTILKIVAKQR